MATSTEEQQAAMTFITATSSGSSGGSQGIAGKDGRDGRDGKDGAVGLMGPQGPKGDDGRDGMDGPRGKDGMTGVAGAMGPKGDDGVKGNDGPVGSQGVPGPIGPRGDDGRDGMDGSDGRPGPTGEKGPKGDMGHMGPMGPKGDIGPAGEPGTLVGGQISQLSIGTHVNPGNYQPPLFVSKKDYAEDYDDTNETISNTINSWYTNQTSALYLNSNPNLSRDIPINNGTSHIPNQPVDGISIVSAGTIITEAIVLASDERIKHQISPLESSAHMLDKLVPVTYLLREDHPGTIPRHGFIAQNVKEAIPGSVTGSPNWVPSVLRWCDVVNLSNGANLTVGGDVVSEFKPLLLKYGTIRIRTRSKNGKFVQYSCDSIVSKTIIHITESVPDPQPCDSHGNIMLKYNDKLMRLIGETELIPEYVTPITDTTGHWAGDVFPSTGIADTKKVFTWGHEVMDFHSVDMMSIISVLADSVKRLSREVDEMKRR
jgi:hypothetical protein